MPKIVVLSINDIDNILIDGAEIYNQNNCKKEFHCDILLIMPYFNAYNLKINTKIAIVYGDLGFKTIQNIKYQEIITYGMSSKNTATISSICSNNILVAIQREITNIYGNIFEISEYFADNSSENHLESLALSLLCIINGKQTETSLKYFK